MPEKHLYEYAVIRVVPKVEREEFVNVGVIMFSKLTGYLKVRIEINENRLGQFTSEIDTECLRANLSAFEKICSGSKDGGYIATLDAPDRFRWLTAVRSASIQTSRPHSGFSEDMNATFERLFNEVVL